MTFNKGQKVKVLMKKSKKFAEGEIVSVIREQAFQAHHGIGVCNWSCLVEAADGRTGWVATHKLEALELEVA